jgi:hypothetical protein
MAKVKTPEELETLREGEEPRDRAGIRERSPWRGGGTRRNRRATRRTIRCFGCAEWGHYARDCRQDPDPPFPGWRYGGDRRRNRGADLARESPTAPGDRYVERPRGLGLEKISVAMGSLWRYTPLSHSMLSLL